MVRKSGALYFSPDQRFSEIDFADADQVVKAFQERVRGYYLEPAKMLLGEGYLFGACLLCAVCVDFLARYSLDIDTRVNEKPGLRMARWLENEIAEFGEQDPTRKGKTLACRFVADHRDGLVHHGLVKEAGFVSNPGPGKIVWMEKQAGTCCMGVDVERLLAAVGCAFDEFCDSLNEPARQAKFCEVVRKVFEADLAAVESHANE